jgi:hypothetical protein
MPVSAADNMDREQFAQTYIAAHNQAATSDNAEPLLALMDTESLACWQGQDRELLSEQLFEQVKDNPVPQDAKVFFRPAEQSALVNMLKNSPMMHYRAEPDLEMVIRYGTQTTDKCTGRAIYRAKNIVHTIRKTDQGWRIANACMTEQGLRQARLNRTRNRQLEQNAAAAYQALPFRVKKTVRRVLKSDGRDEAAKVIRQHTHVGRQEGKLVVDMICREEPSGAAAN